MQQIFNPGLSKAIQPQSKLDPWMWAIKGFYRWKRWSYIGFYACWKFMGAVRISMFWMNTCPIRISLTFSANSCLERAYASKSTLMGMRASRRFWITSLRKPRNSGRTKKIYFTANFKWFWQRRMCRIANNDMTQINIRVIESTVKIFYELILR